MDITDETTHRHGTSCWWSPERVDWVCARTPAADTDRDPVDVRDMLVVHTALLREFRLAPDAVARVPFGARRRATTVERYLGLLCDLLHHHHAGEDELLWPPLRERLPVEALPLLEEAEAQHAALDEALQSVGSARREWIERIDAESRDALVASLSTLYRLLAEHLDTEERTLLPLAAVHLTEGEWRAVGAAGAASVPKSKLPLVFGMFAYEGDPEVLATMLHDAPAVPRLLVPRLAPRIYARRAALVHGTRRP
jgi:hemerythrin HHE cation binding domain-containing protein